MSRRPSRSKTVTVRLTDADYQAAQLVAAATCRTVSTLMQWSLRQFVVEHFPDAMHPDAQLEVAIRKPA